MSNPTKTSGFFFDTHNKLRSHWRSWQVSSRDVPRARGHIEIIEAAYGVGSNKSRVRIDGEFPTADDDTVIPLEWVEAAIGREVETPKFFPIWGIDVARFGDDRSALAKRQANRLLEPVKFWRGLDTMQLSGRIHREWVDTHEDLRPKEILIDVIGIGAGVVDRCKEMGLPVRGINVGESAAAGEQYMRLRDELWFRGREWFEDKSCSICNDQALIAELTTVTYDFHSNNKIVVESKRLLKERGLPSCDLADAFLLTFATNDQRKQPIKRIREELKRDVWAA